jgi:hypothetical protein
MLSIKQKRTVKKDNGEIVETLVFGFIAAIIGGIGIGIGRNFVQSASKRFKPSRLNHTHANPENILQSGQTPDDFFKFVGTELQSGNLEPGSWAKAVLIADSDESKARVEYIKLRVSELQLAYETELAKEQLKKTAEIQRLEEENLRSKARREKVRYFRQNPQIEEILYLSRSKSFIDFIRTVKSGTREEVRDAVTKDVRLMFCTDTDGMTALCHAVIEQRQSVVKILLEAGADPNVDVGNRSLLEIATDRRSTGIQALLEAYLDL